VSNTSRHYLDVHASCFALKVSSQVFSTAVRTFLEGDVFSEMSVEYFLSFVYISLKEIDLLLVSAFFPRTDSCLDLKLRSQHYT